MSILAMFGLFRAGKFWVALIWGLLQSAQMYTGIDFGLDQATLTTIMSGLGALLVWLVPNLKPKDDRLPNTYYPPRPDGAGMF